MFNVVDGDPEPGLEQPPASEHMSGRTTAKGLRNLENGDEFRPLAIENITIAGPLG